MKDKKEKWLKYFSLGVALIFVYQICNNLEGVMEWLKGFTVVLAPFLWGILIAYLFYIPCRGLEKKLKKTKKNGLLNRKARGISVLAVYLIALLILILVFQYIIPILAQSIGDLINNFQSYYTASIEKLDQKEPDEFLSNPIVQEVIKRLKEVDWSQFTTFENIVIYAKGVGNAVTGSFSSFVALIVSVYILLGRGEIVAYLCRLGKSIFKPKTYNLLYSYFEKGNEIFFKYVGSQFLDAILVGSIASVALSILGVKYAVLLGVMIGLSNMIPYIGAIVGIRIAAIITLITGGLGQAIAMLVTIIILQQLDANIINPKIVGDSLKISPLLVIFAVTVIGAYFGIIGMFLSVPIIALAKLMLEHFMAARAEQKQEKIEE